MERRLGSKFREATWGRLLGSGIVSEYASRSHDFEGKSDSDAFVELLGWAKDFLEYQQALELEILPEPEEDGEGDTDAGPRGSSPTEPQLPFTVELPEREQARANVLLEIQMRQAAEHPDVDDFRRRRLGDRLLSAEEAETYFTPGRRETISDSELANLGRRLKRDYGWHRDDAAWFVLTGEPPTLRPLAASFFDNVSMYGPSYCELTLRVAPWIPAEEVKKAFERMRNQVRGGSGPGTVSEQRLEVLRFVEGERAKHGQRPNFEVLLQRWNQKYPHWSYADYRALSKAYREARKEVLYPKYHSPVRAKTPNMERQEARNLKLGAAIREREAKRARDASAT